MRVRSTSADSALIWLGCVGRCVDQRGLRVAGAADDRRAALVPTAVSELSTSDEVSRSWAPTSVDTANSDSCAARAPAWMVSLVLTMRWVSERSASSTCDLMPADSSSARAISESLAVRPDVSIRPATASMRDPSSSSNWSTRVSMSVTMDADAAFEALVDRLEARGDGVGEVRAAIVDRLGDVGDAAVDGADRLRGAVGQRRREVGQAVVDRVDRLHGAVGERRGEVGQAAVDGADGVVGAFGQGRGQAVEAIVDRHDGLVGAVGEGRRQIRQAAVDGVDRMIGAVGEGRGRSGCGCRSN